MTAADQHHRHGGHHAGSHEIAAHLRTGVITAGEVDARVAELRRGPRAALLPAPATAEGRQLRRWTAQVLVTERLLHDEARRHGLSAPPDAPRRLPPSARIDLGSVLAAVLATSPPAWATYDLVTADVTVSDAAVHDYRDRLHGSGADIPRRWVVHRHRGRRINNGKPYLLAANEVPPQIAEAVFAGQTNDKISPSPDHWFELGEIQAADDTSAAPALRAIRDALTHAERRRVFALWTSAQIADHVRLMPGFEHPADIHQPDSTHHH
ncbi:DUF7158 domain-containing protein [Nonomuraea sp. bgisy101]|uniref:DUF7158 domain-containing protein n=1 Tax=Nonomuraea sp. bgisy101 TaxID=3413784 RepID=UPI003D708734